MYQQRVWLTQRKPNMASSSSSFSSFSSPPGAAFMDLCIMVVADVSLTSASRLAEHALRAPELLGGCVDLVLVGGPLVRPALDLRPYHHHHRPSSHGRRRVRHGRPYPSSSSTNPNNHPTGQQQRYNNNNNNNHNGNASTTTSGSTMANDNHNSSTAVSTPTTLLTGGSGSLSSPPTSNNNNNNNNQGSSSPEWIAACEGLVTGALSQLESIVCRVLFVPAIGHDPITTTTTTTTTTTSTSQPYELRLTPNARNIQSKLLPLAPRLGCIGVAVPTMETETIMPQHQNGTKENRQGNLNGGNNNQ